MTAVCASSATAQAPTALALAELKSRPENAMRDDASEYARSAGSRDTSRRYSVSAEQPALALQSARQKSARVRRARSSIHVLAARRVGLGMEAIERSRRTVKCVLRLAYVVPERCRDIGVPEYARNLGDRNASAA